MWLYLCLTRCLFVRVAFIPGCMELSASVASRCSGRTRWSVAGFNAQPKGPVVKGGGGGVNLHDYIHF